MDSRSSTADGKRCSAWGCVWSKDNRTHWWIRGALKKRSIGVTTRKAPNCRNLRCLPCKVVTRVVGIKQYKSRITGPDDWDHSLVTKETSTKHTRRAPACQGIIIWCRLVDAPCSLCPRPLHVQSCNTILPLIHLHLAHSLPVLQGPARVDCSRTS